MVTSDLDSLLDESELRDSKQSFWRRYRQRFPPEVHPSDATISRVSCEMSKRMLCIYSVWKVKTLQRQLLTSQKKRKLGETLLLAYAMAGVAQPATSDPTFDAKNEAILGSDSTMYAVAPLDICMQYFFFALRGQQLSSQPPSDRNGSRLATWKNAVSGHRGSGKAPPPSARL